MSDTSAGRDEYRLTEADEDRMRAAIRATVSERGWRWESANEVALERIAAHSIGCSWFDLRESECQWVRNEVGEVRLGLS